MDAKKIGKAIKVLRSRIGYTQYDLADALGVTDKAVSKWERGLSVPDIAVITQLSLILNCDLDNLLEGNITFLEQAWQGLLVISGREESIFSGTTVYNKPLVYFFLSYFMLAGVRRVYIKCAARDKAFISERLGDGSNVGLSIIFIEDIAEIETMNTMVVYDEPFVYGPNLTKYFQRAMSRQNRISVLTVYKGKDDHRCTVGFDNLKTLQFNKSTSCYYVPICFVPKELLYDLGKVFDIQQLIESKKVYAEPMGNGMIEYSVKTEEDVFQTASFIRFLENMMGNKVYELDVIAKNRNLL